MAAKTNVEFVTDLMDFAKSGPLMQAFVIEALRKYAEKVAQADPAALDSPMVSGAAWKACGVEALAALQAQYE